MEEQMKKYTYTRPDGITITFTRCSPEAEKHIQQHVAFNMTLSNKPHEKWPINMLEVGECFLIPRHLIKRSISTFRQYMHKKAERATKGVIVIYHKEHKLVEVARIY